MKPKKLPRGSSTIRIHFYQEMYQTIMDDEKKFRAYIDECIKSTRNCFPSGQLKDTSCTAKRHLQLSWESNNGGLKYWRQEMFIA